MFIFRIHCNLSIQLSFLPSWFLNVIKFRLGLMLLNKTKKDCCSMIRFANRKILNPDEVTVKRDESSSEVSSSSWNEPSLFWFESVSSSQEKYFEWEASCAEIWDLKMKIFCERKFSLNRDKFSLQTHQKGRWLSAQTLLRKFQLRNFKNTKNEWMNSMLLL